MSKGSGLATRIKMVIALSLVFILIIATNLVDNASFNIVKKSIEGIYDDRLVAKNLLFKLQKHIYDKKVEFLLTQSDLPYKKPQPQNESIVSLLSQYNTTNLTRDEKKYFNVLREDILELKKLESQYYTAQQESNLQAGKQIYRQFQQIDQHLDMLLEIQLTEGKRKLANSIRAVDNSNLISKIEIFFLVVIGIVILIFVFYKAKPQAGAPKLGNHNH